LDSLKHHPLTALKKLLRVTDTLQSLESLVAAPSGTFGAGASQPCSEKRNWVRIELYLQERNEKLAPFKLESLAREDATAKIPRFEEAENTRERSGQRLATT
jgi:hypothetical protein